MSIVIHAVMDARDKISGLSDEELVRQLKELKQDVGPLTPTTRPLYEKRLLKHMLLEQASACTLQYTSSDKNANNGTGDYNSKSPDLGSPNGMTSSREAELLECSTFYAVQLPADLQKSSGVHFFIAHFHSLIVVGTN